MNTYGDTNRFAISVQLSDDIEGHFLAGRCCLHVCGTVIGQPDREEYLYILLNDIEMWLSSSSRRGNEWLMRMEPDEFILTVGAGVFSTDHPNKLLLEKRAESEGWYYLDVCPSLQAFFDVWIFLIEDEQRARLIYSGVDYSPIYECLLEPGEFDSVVAAAAAYLKPVAEVELAKVKAQRLLDGSDY